MNKVNDTLWYKGATIELRYKDGDKKGYIWYLDDGSKCGVATSVYDCTDQIDLYWDELDSSLPC